MYFKCRMLRPFFCFTSPAGQLAFTFLSYSGNTRGQLFLEDFTFLPPYPLPILAILADVVHSQTYSINKFSSKIENTERLNISKRYQTHRNSSWKFVMNVLATPSQTKSNQKEPDEKVTGSVWLPGPEVCRKLEGSWLDCTRQCQNFTLFTKIMRQNLGSLAQSGQFP